MSDDLCPRCGLRLGRINGRSLKEAVDLTQANHPLGDISSTVWVDVCPRCDAYALGAETVHPWPLLWGDGAMCTCEDFDSTTGHYLGIELDFYGFRFSHRALASTLTRLRMDAATRKTEDRAGVYLAQPGPQAAFAFSQAVCAWGRGGRVWGNLLRHHSEASLGKQLDEWLRNMPDRSERDAIACGIAIKGLGISFASKHLRIIDPSRFAVLDDVICQGLGVAMNVQGYLLFLRLLQAFRVEHALLCSVAELESALFLLVRQSVRARP